MTRWLPRPLMAGLLLLAWLLLNQSLAPGTIVLGTVLALGLSWALDTLQPPIVHMRRPDKLLRLLLRVIVDSVRSNFAVARLILLRRHQFSAGFVTIPLELTSPYGLAVLACIITATPGTAWVSHDSSRRLLVIHVLDLVDEQVSATYIKQTYERALLEVFQ